MLSSCECNWVKCDLLVESRHFLPASATGCGEQSRAEAASLLVGLHHHWDLVKVRGCLARQSEEEYSRLGIWSHVLARAVIKPGDSLPKQRGAVATLPKYRVATITETQPRAHPYTRVWYLRTEFAQRRPPEPAEQLLGVSPERDHPVGLPVTAIMNVVTTSMRVLVAGDTRSNLS